MDDKKIDLNLLLAFEALLAELNVTRAAQRLNLSQPALSAKLTRLRVLFGDELFIPTSRGVIPTAKASELQGPLRQALDQMRGLVASSHRFDPSTAEMTFSISCSDYVQVAILLPFLLELNKTAPKIKVMVKQNHDSNSLAIELDRGEVDVVFLQREDLEGTVLRRLDVFTERYVGVARKGNPVAKSMTIDRFTAERHIIVSPRAEGFQGPTDVALATVGRFRDVAFAVSSFVFLVEAVSRSDLIAVAPERLVARYEDRVDVFEPPVPVPGFTIAMAWHDRTHGHPGRVWLRTQLAEFCQGGSSADQLSKLPRPPLLPASSPRPSP